MKQTDQKIKYIELVQSVIVRFSNNGFILKGWATSLVLGFFVFIPKGEMFSPVLLVFSYIPVVTFWLFDAFQLQYERKYRKLYDSVIKLKEEDKITFDLDVKEKYRDVGYFQCFSSKTLMFYPIIIILINLIIILCCLNVQ